MKLSFDNITLDLNIFNLQRQPDSFDNMDHSTFNWVGDISCDELAFEFVLEYESFFMDGEPKYGLFEFDTCSVDFIAEIASACDTSAMLLDLEALPDSLKYTFLGPNASLLVIIASTLDQN